MNLFRNLLFWIVLALLGALAAQLLLADPGYVLVRFRGYDYETSVATVALATLAALVVLWLAWKLLMLPFRSWRAHRDRRGRARLGAARAAIARGDHAAARSHLAALDESQAALRAIALAELALDEHRPTDALVALDAPAAQPLPPRGLALRAEAMAANGQAAQAYGLLGTLRQQQALPAARLDELQER